MVNEFSHAMTVGVDGGASGTNDDHCVVSGTTTSITFACVGCVGFVSMKFVKKVMSSNDDVVIIPQPLKDGVAAVTPLVKLYRSRTEVPDKEVGSTMSLGVRMGRLMGDDGKWYRGVSKHTFHEVIDMLERYSDWDEVGVWQDAHEYVYTVKHEKVTTRVELNTFLNVTHSVRTCEGRAMLGLGEHGHARVYVRYDTKVAQEDVPETVTPSRVCIEKRRCFVKGVWHFEVAYMWYGSTRTCAEVAQSCDNCVYNVDIKFVPGETKYWDDTQRGNCTYVATSLLMKVVNVLSSEMFGITVLA